MNKENTAHLSAIARRVTLAMSIASRSRSTEFLPTAGERKSRVRGELGQDIVSMSDYQPGDDVRSIDWYASAAEGHVVVRHVLEPRDKQVVVLSDVRPSLLFGSRRTTKLGLSSEILFAIALSAHKSRDRMSFVAFDGSRVRMRISARSPKATSAVALPYLLDQNLMRQTGAPPGSGLIKALSLVPKKSSIVYVLSDFVSLNGDETAHLSRTAATNDLTCVWLQDLRERELPDTYGTITCEDGAGGQTKTFWLAPWSKERVRRRYAQEWSAREQALRAHLKDAHCRLREFSTEETVEVFARKLARLFAGV